MVRFLRWASILVFTIAAGFFWQRGQWEIALTSIVLPLLVGLVPLLFQKGAVDHKKKESWLKSHFAARDFQKEYFELLRYQHRDFDIKGLSTQTVHTLDLEQVFVELRLQPQAAHKASSDPLNHKLNKLRGDSYPIWKFLRLLGETERTQNAKLVIVGPPGSGKTTLMRHLAILLASPSRHPELKKQKLHKVPLLLFLRDHVKDIVTDSAIMLPALVESTIKKWDVTVPANWFQKRLKDGSFLIMLDGLDEVADIMSRHQVVTWIEKQIRAYPKNAFIVTSRPHGYKDFPLTGVSVLEVMPFNQAQIEQFVQNWYLANEIKSHAGDDKGVRMAAKSGSDDLLRRLEKNASLMELAVNPLLLTMIATVHRYRSALPGRRVELYKEICEVFLGKRQEAKGLDNDLIPIQKQTVLQSLAYEMMYSNIREIRTVDAAAIVMKPLTLVGSTLSPDDFLKNVEHQSGLLVEREMGVYGFAHKTFQEYLTSMYMLDGKLESELNARINEDWWHEVIKLYAAQTDATGIITTCLSQEPPTAAALSLAMQCLEEARQVQPSIKEAVGEILDKTAEDPDPEIRGIVAEALLASRIKHLVAFSPSISIDTIPVTNAEYQVFIDDVFAREHRPIYPKHWQTRLFAMGTSHEPALGLLPGDAVAFCEWLTELHAGSGEWHFRLPTEPELVDQTYAKIPGVWILADPNSLRSDRFKEAKISCRTTFAVPKVPEHYVQQMLQTDLKSIISVLRRVDQQFDQLDHDLYSQLDHALKKILRVLPKSNEILVKTADEIYKSIIQIPTNRCVDYGYGSPDPEAYDESISNSIERNALDGLESGVMSAITCFSNIVRSDPRTLNRHKPLFVAFALNFLINWVESTKMFFSRNSMSGIQRKIDFLLDWYVDDVIVSARQQNVIQPFEGLIIAREIRDPHN